MKSIFDTVSYDCSKWVTKAYSTSFSLATRLLGASIRPDIYNIYGFVRFADEIVDSFHGYDKEALFNGFEQDLYAALKDRISINPILNSFQHTYHKHGIPLHLVTSFMHSMRLDLSMNSYNTDEEYNAYIYGSADVVGLMCLKVFVQGNQKLYEKLKPSAMALGSAFQKVNFLRDLKEDLESLDRTYFPYINLAQLNEESKTKIIKEIEDDFKLGHSGILELPNVAKFGVYMAYQYYHSLLRKLQNTPPLEIMNARIRVPNHQKFGLLAKSYLNYKLNLV